MNISGLWNRHIGKSSDYSRGPNALDDMAASATRKVPVGAGLGAAVGAAAGYAYGLNNLIQDKVTVVERTYEVQRPVLVGADYDPEWTEFQNVYDDKGNLSYVNTIHHDDDWDPILARQSTGQTYTRKEFEHSRGLGPMASAAVGMGVGAVVGGLAGVAAGMITKDSHQWTRPSDKGNHAPKIGAAVGGLTGATLGAIAGKISQSKAEILTQTVSEPVFERQTIGYIPHDSDYRSIPRGYFEPGHRLHYDRLPEGAYGTPPFAGKEAIVRDVPTGEFQSRTTSETSHRLTPLTGALLGAGIGAVGGFAAGVAVGVLQKTLDS